MQNFSRNNSRGRGRNFNRNYSNDRSRSRERRLSSEGIIIITITDKTQILEYGLSLEDVPEVDPTQE